MSSIAPIIVVTDHLTAYEIAIAQELGASSAEIEDIADAKKCRDERKQDEDDDENEGMHDDACDCNQCERDLFDGECDENHDGGEQVRTEWRARVAKAKVAKAFITLNDGEAFVRTELKRIRDYTDKVAREKAAYEKAKAEYVHVEGTSSWLKYGMVPSALRRQLMKVPGVKDVRAETNAIGGAKMCVLSVEWPYPDLSGARKEAHFRVLLAQEGFNPCTKAEVHLVTWASE